LGDIIRKNLGGSNFKLLAGALLLILPAVLWTQEAARQTVCLISSVDLEPGEDTAGYGEIITDTLRVELQNAGFEVLPAESWKELQSRWQLSDLELILGPNVLRIAARIGADLGVAGFYRVQDGKILLDVKGYDVAQKRLVSGVLKSGRIGISIYNLINDAIGEMLPAIREEVVPPSIVVRQRDQRLREIRLESPDEGMEIYMAGETLLGKIEAGVLTFPSYAGAVLEFETKKEGFHDRTYTLAVDQEHTHFNLQELRKRTRWASEIIYTAGQTLGVGLGMRYYLEPDQLFLSLEDYYYLQYVPIADSRPVHHDDLRTLIGSYLLTGPYSSFRMGISSGFGVIFTGFSAPDMPCFTDYYLNFNLWFEWNLSGWILYFRLEGKYGLGLGQYLLGQRWLSSEIWGPPFSIGVVKKW
jgi:hypothetical protein